MRLEAERADANVTHRRFSTAASWSESRLLVRDTAVMKVARFIQIHLSHSELPMFRILLESMIHRATVTDYGLVVVLFTAVQGLADNRYAKDNPWDI